MGKILIRHLDGTWREPEHAGYAAEAELQHILAAHPELIPGVSADAVACREFQSAVGPADVIWWIPTGRLKIYDGQGSRLGTVPCFTSRGRGPRWSSI